MSEEKRDYAADLAALKSIPNFQVKLYSGLGYCLFTEKGIYHKYLSEELADFIALAHTILPWYIRKTRELEAELAEAEAKMEAWEKLCVGYMAERDAAEGREGALREALEHIIEYWNRDRNDNAMHDALREMIETAEQALSTPAPVNLEAMRRVCEAAKEIKAKIDRHIGSGGYNNIEDHLIFRLRWEFRNARKELDDALAGLEGGDKNNERI